MILVKYLLPILLAFCLSSCAYREPAPIVDSSENPTQEAHAETREQIFTYGRASSAREVILKFGDEPIALSCGYVKLTGTILGDNPQAVIEAGGKGVLLSIGEEIGDYKVAMIKDKEVKLCSKK